MNRPVKVAHHMTAPVFDALVDTTLRLSGRGGCPTLDEALAVLAESGLSEPDQALAKRHLTRMYQQAERERQPE